ncbi:hypothetical protein M8494_36590 [Serratia ureilytica]
MLEELQLTLVTKSSRHFITLRDEHARCPGDMWGFVHYKTGDFLIYESVFEKLCSEKGLKTVDGQTVRAFRLSAWRKCRTL